MISKHYKHFKNFGKCLEISNGNVKALITVDVGPRIIYYGYKGYNLMYEDVERKTQKSGDFFDRNFKCGETWYAYGGHRLWRANEDLGSYDPDNYPVKVERTENGAVFTPPLQRYTKLQAVTEVEMKADGSLVIKQKMTNTDEKPQTLSLWGITGMRPGGVEIIPLNREDTGLLPNQNFVYWPYDDRKDKRIHISPKYAVLKQNKKNDRAFKLGFFNHYGWTAYNVGKYLYVRRFEVDDAVHTDYQCNCETYVKGDYLEMEVMSKEVTLAQNESAELVETFEVHTGVKFDGYDDASVDKALKGITL